MSKPDLRAARMRELFARAVETEPDQVDALLAAHAGDDPSLVAEIKALLAADAAASARVPSRMAPHAQAVLDLRDIGGLPLDLPIVHTAVTLIEATDAHTALIAARHPTDEPFEGSVISHYRVKERLGAGGMGVVYSARDLALGRMAALKVLPDVFTADLRERLLLEADASARLQHPAIATYYESGEIGGTAFIAMELVAGETLRRRLGRGPIPVNDALAWIACVLEALSHAHAAGILHRDIKPENIMLTGPRSAKLLDFGLAKHLLLEDAETAATMHTAAAVAGTLGYMSPEQIRNDPQDRRSDIFQVGAVLYEMLTGRPAFPGSSAAERLVAVLARDPDPIDNAEVPASLTAAVMRALARDPERRYPSAAALLSDLRAVTAGESVGELPDAVAILDFDNLSGDPAQAWIATGVTEALGTDLKKVNGLEVLPRERIVKVRAAIGSASAEPSPAAIGLRLGCRWVMAGSYQTVGDALRITMRLVETATEKTVVMEKIDGALSELFRMQDQLAAVTLRALDLDDAQRPRPAARPSLDAYESYIRGRRLFLRLEKGSMDQARQYYEDAVRVEPGYGLALCGLAGFHAMQYTFTTDVRVLNAAAEYAHRAIKADPSLAEARNWLAYALMRLGRLKEASEEWQRARTLDPSFFLPFFFGGGIGFLIGKADEGLRLMQRAVELEPRLSYPVWALACLHMQMGNYKEALWSFEHAAVVDRARGRRAAVARGRWTFTGNVCAASGGLDDARARCLIALEEVEKSDHMYRDTNRVFCLVSLGRIALQQGDEAAARAAYGQAIAHIQGRRRTLAGGWLVVQALAGLARTSEGGATYKEAHSLVSAARQV